MAEGERLSKPTSGAVADHDATAARLDWPLVSIITINYNQPGLTRLFLNSVSRLTYPNFEVIVVDNGSKEDPTEAVRSSDYPEARLFLTGQNLGFSGGNNLGMRLAKGDFYFIVNNDTEVTPDLIDALMEPMLANPTIGVVCPKIRYFDQPEVIQYAGYNPMNVYTGQAGMVGSHEVDKGQFDRPGPTSFAHGCAMLVRREVVERVGAFAEQFFLYYEELDWSARILRGGYQIYFQPTALIYHKESSSVGKASPLKVYYMTRNRILYMRRNTPLSQRAVFYAFLTGMVIPKHVLTYLLKGQFAYLKAFCRGLAWNVTHAL
ncbi:glycosyltransferase family 2 protein [Spirosoma taeanense]|uniref:Glycosyltransferase family 2 protein n=1 Tax=Spirosoma taeanense TaxID=2735870 RepID=A0A6M5Y622_9BACT|nr:glycosyltransferase family 2 protein [Spirosoma taeanense]QJW88152.1 glycosyltransferase family 2 protein [Spirosoma taeanense]